MKGLIRNETNKKTNKKTKNNQLSDIDEELLSDLEKIYKSHI